MNIGTVSKASCVSERMIRHYELIGLVPKPERGNQGFRYYSDSHLHTLKFIRNARDIGLSVDQIGYLLALWHNSDLTAAEVSALTAEAREALEVKARKLEFLQSALDEVAAGARNGKRPPFPTAKDPKLPRRKTRLRGPANARKARKEADET